MDIEILLIFCLAILILGGSVLSFKNQSDIKELLKKVKSLESTVRIQASEISALQIFRKKLEASLAESAKKDNLAGDIVQETDKTLSPDPDAGSDMADQALKAVQSGLDSPENLLLPESGAPPVSPVTDIPNVSRSPAETVAISKAPTEATTESNDISLANKKIETPTPVAQKSADIRTNTFDLDTFLSGNGLLWLGAIVLALGGVFLARYSIEAGLVSPLVRVVTGSLFGVALIAAAEYLHRHAARFNINTPYISAAIAGGGFITCFAMTMVAFEFYQFLSPQAAFIVLAIIAVAATYMSLRFGPVLAAVGLIGAYAVPALVSTGSNNYLALFFYIAFVSGSAIWVAETVQKKWLWWLSFAGHVFWLLLTVMSAHSDDFIAVLLFSLISIYYYSIAGVLGWQLKNTRYGAFTLRQMLMPRKEQAGVLISLLALALFLSWNGADSNVVWANVALFLVLGSVAMRHSAFDTWPFYGLVFAGFSVYRLADATVFDDNLFLFQGRYLFVQVSVLVGLAFSLFMIHRYVERYSYLVLMVATPIALYGLSYVLSNPLAEDVLYPLWAFELLVIAGVAAFLAVKASDKTLKVGYLVLLNACLTLCLTMLLHASTLTMAIAVQIASMSYLSRKYQVSVPDWLFKIALSVVVFRLTIAPWLDSYSNELILGMHWTLVIYPLVVAIIWFSKQWNTSTSLQNWFTGVLVHVVALFVTTETSYFLLGRYPVFGNLEFREAILLSMHWMILAGVYLWRASLASTLASIYQKAGYVLLFASLLIHFDVSLFGSPFWDSQFVGSFVINWLLPLWAIPAIILFLIVTLNLVQTSLKRPLIVLGGIFVFFYINGMIRSMFNDGVLDISQPVKQMELYSYSIVWLTLSIAAIFAAQTFSIAMFRKLGFGILALVVLKAFLVDMSNLEGLYRAMSFIGLGLSLVGIGWLFQKLKMPEEDSTRTI